MKRRMASLLVVALLAACGGGGGSTGGSIPVTPVKNSSSMTVKLALIVPNAAKGTGSRRRQLISPSAQGASISVTGAHGGTGSGIVDLSSASSACTTTASQRTCTASVVAPIDNDTFTITLYDAPPANGAIPSSAHVLGVGTVGAAITSSFTGSVAVAVGGQIASIGLSPTFVSLPSGAPSSAGIAIAPADFGNNPISGTSPYANPITVTLSETGGRNHMHLVLDGTTVTSASATLSSPSDTIAVSYDGLGTAGYSSSITLAASGAATQTLTVSPLFLSSTSPFFSNGTLSLNGAATTIPIAASEANAPATMSYTAQLAAACSSIATASAVSGSGTGASFTVTGGASASANGCIVTVTDSNATAVRFNVINSPVGGTIPLPGESIQEYTIQTIASAPPASPQAIGLGPDGRVWIGDVLNYGFEVITSSGTISAYTGASGAFAMVYPGGFAAGSDGFLYAADANNVAIDKITPSTGNVNPMTVSYTPKGIASGLDGNVWFTELGGGGFGYVGYYTPGGVLTEYDLSSRFIVASPSPAGIAANPAGGNLWFCEDVDVGVSRVDAVSYSGAMSTIVSSPALPTDCGTIAFQPDGKAAWATSTSASQVYRIDATTHAVTTISLAGSPTQIVAGADNAMYVTEYKGSGYVARISTAAPYVLNEMPVPSAGAIPTGIALGADGRLWFGENSQNKVGALTP